jgi:hydrogenase expression/formation protein HypC
MCVALPGRVVAVDDDGRTARVDVDGAERRVALTVLVLDGTRVEPGQWLLVHTGLAVEVLEPGAAEELLALHRRVHEVVEETRRNDHAGA